MFLPTTREEIQKLKWDRPDVIIVTGDTYIDSPYIGAAVIGKVLLKAGFKVAIIAQPETASADDITRLGEPALFWGVTGGSVDSMVANYTPLRKFRRSDDFTPGGENARRPDRAVIAYANLIRKNFKNTKPIVLGGIEASLRRVSHYDFWDDKIRRPILFDAKADILVYGMGETAAVELAQKLKAGAGIENIRGICYISKDPVESYIQLPGHAEAASDKLKFIDMFNEFYKNNDPLTARGLCQKVDTRYLVQAPPAACLPEEKLDEIHDMDFERDVHPFYKKNGAVKALDTIKFSITTHRGCYGECNFCAIAVHQGRTVQSRSEDSIIREAQTISRIPDFKGYILDAGGPTANMYAIECDKKLKSGACRDRRCLFPRKCKKLEINHKRQIELLKKLSRVKGVKKVFVASGIRYDMILCDKTYGNEYMNEIIENHVSGQLKIAPEHTEDRVLSRMGKTGKKDLVEFKDKFYEINKKTGKKQFLTYYIIAAHPGCDESDMKKLKDFASKELHASPEQVQIFTPTPSTYSTLMYYTEKDPFTKEPVFVEKDAKKKERQKEIITGR